MTTDEAMSDTRKGWRRAAGLLGVVLATSILQPIVLVAVPLLILLGLEGRGTGAIVVAAIFGFFVVLAGPRDGLWFVERAWALIAGGVFAALATYVPHWRLTSRSMAAVGSAIVISGVFLTIRRGAWAAIDWQVTDHLRSGFATWLDVIAVLRDGEAVPPTLVTAIYQTVEAQAQLFPALMAIETMAALGLAWWVFGRVAPTEEKDVGTLRGFRFNDHLVWLMIAGLAMVALLPEDGGSRLGANVAVFMGSLYALRGIGVVVFVNGGLTFIGITMFALGILFAAPVVIGFTVLLGIADTWLDLRARAGAQAA